MNEQLLIEALREASQTTKARDESDKGEKGGNKDEDGIEWNTFVTSIHDDPALDYVTVIAEEKVVGGENVDANTHLSSDFNVGTTIRKEYRAKYVVGCDGARRSVYLSCCYTSCFISFHLTPLRFPPVHYA